MWGGLLFATAFSMLGFGQYLAGFSPVVPVVGSALGMAALLTLVHYRGVKETGSLQNVIVILLVVLIVAFIAFGFTVFDASLLTPFAPEGWGAVGLTAGTVFVTFIGVEVIATSAEEIKDPARNLPLSMIAAVVTPTLLECSRCSSRPGRYRSLSSRPRIPRSRASPRSSSARSARSR